MLWKLCLGCFVLTLKWVVAKREINHLTQIYSHHINPPLTWTSWGSLSPPLCWLCTAAACSSRRSGLATRRAISTWHYRASVQFQLNCGLFGKWSNINNLLRLRFAKAPLIFTNYAFKLLTCNNVIIKFVLWTIYEFDFSLKELCMMYTVEVEMCNKDKKDN